MAHFYMNAQGNRGETTRMGTKASGISAHVRTWSAGVDVSMLHTSEGEDVADIAITHGSNGPSASNFLRLTAADLTDILEGRSRLAVVPVDSEKSGPVNILPGLTVEEV